MYVPRFPFKTVRGSGKLLRPETANLSDNRSVPDAEKIDRYKYLSQLTRGLELDVDTSTIFTWHDLVIGVHDSASRLISERKEHVSAKSLSRGNYRTVLKGIRKDTRLGTGHIGAFLEVIPRVFAAEKYDDPNQKITEAAQKSTSLIVAWSRADPTTDKELVSAIANPRLPSKPRDGWRQYDNLRFDPSFFEPHPSGGIRFNTSLVDGLADKNPYLDTTASPAADVIGCPAQELIPTMCSYMITVAAERGLFVETYHAARSSEE